jgi:hypothetical protein
VNLSEELAGEIVAVALKAAQDNLQHPYPRISIEADYKPTCAYGCREPEEACWFVILGRGDVGMTGGSWTVVAVSREGHRVVKLFGDTGE